MEKNFMPNNAHRHTVFQEIQRLVQDYDECPAAHTHWNLDDALSDLIIRLNGETRRARKVQHQSVGSEMYADAT
jgi:hypothetical protein